MADPQDFFPGIYKITSIPAGCTHYRVGQTTTVLVPEPPPQNIILHYSAPCDPVEAVYDDDDE